MISAEVNNWKILNSHTIEEALDGEVRLHTRVPKPFRMQISALSANISVDWDFETGRHVTRRSLDVHGEFEDRITLIHLVNGTRRLARSAMHFSVYPMDEGELRPEPLPDGGFDAFFAGTGYSGLSAKLVPDGGLMPEARGRMIFGDPDDETEEGDIGVTVPMGVAAFDEIFAVLKSAPSAIKGGTISVLADIFETALSAAFSDEPWNTEYFFVQDILNYAPGHEVRDGWTGSTVRTLRWTGAQLESMNVELGNASTTPEPTRRKRWFFGADDG